MRIPVLRAGDTVYIPDQGQDFGQRAKSSVVDFLTILALAVGL